MTGHDLPKIRTFIPGARSKQLAARLARVESPNITYADETFPIFWKRALGANIEDVDGNVYIDLTSAFGVQGIGHSHPLVVEAIARQAKDLIHGMGDVHPTELKVRLAEKLSSITPGNLSQVIFSSSGAEAVESALKTACIFTRKPGVIAFEGAYHGLTYGALGATHRKDFRFPFQDQLGQFAVHVPFPAESDGAGEKVVSAGETLEKIEVLLSDSAIGAVLIEPIQSRGGVRIPPFGFLRELGRLCQKYEALLILDEIMTGFGRTGKWFACNHEDIVPDILVLGKGMTGGFPISACIASEKIMAAWGCSTGEAIHTSTFLGSPLGAASALQTIEILEREHLVERSEILGKFLTDKFKGLAERHPLIHDVRGRGLLLGIELARTQPSQEPACEQTQYLTGALLKEGIIILPCGPQHNVLSFTPPFVIVEAQLRYVLDCLDKHLSLVEGNIAAAAVLRV